MGNLLILGNVPILGKYAYFGKWRISHLRYSFYGIDSSIGIGLFVYNFRKIFLTLESPVLHNFEKIIKMSLKRLNVEKI